MGKPLVGASRWHSTDAARPPDGDGDGAKPRGGPAGWTAEALVNKEPASRHPHMHMARMEKPIGT